MAEAPKTFRDYIATRRNEDSPAGDFIADAKLDPNLPDISTWDELEFHLIQRGASLAAIDAARTVWRRYKDYQRRGSH